MGKDLGYIPGASTEEQVPERIDCSISRYSTMIAQLVGWYATSKIFIGHVRVILEQEAEDSGSDSDEDDNVDGEEMSQFLQAAGIILKEVVFPARITYD